MWHCSRLPMPLHSRFLLLIRCKFTASLRLLILAACRRERRRNHRNGRVGGRVIDSMDKKSRTEHSDCKCLNSNGGICTIMPANVETLFRKGIWLSWLVRACEQQMNKTGRTDIYQHNGTDSASLKFAFTLYRKKLCWTKYI